jgi:hypothetical protein
MTTQCVEQHRDGGASVAEMLNSCRSAASSPRCSSTAVSRCRCSAHLVTSAVTLGLPSRSLPIQERQRRSSGTSSSMPKCRARPCWTSAWMRGAMAQMPVRRKCSPCSISSCTVGRSARTSSVTNSSATCRSSAAFAASTSAGVASSRPSSASSSATRRCLCSTCAAAPPWDAPSASAPRPAPPPATAPRPPCTRAHAASSEPPRWIPAAAPDPANAAGSPARSPASPPGSPGGSTRRRPAAASRWSPGPAFAICAAASRRRPSSPSCSACLHFCRSSSTSSKVPVPARLAMACPSSVPSRSTLSLSLRMLADQPPVNG